MSYQIGIDTIHLRPTTRLAHTEYCSSAAIKRAVGASASAFAGPAEQQMGGNCPAAQGRRFEDLWDIDLIWHTDDGPVPWHQRGRTTDMGHADFLEGGSDRRMPKPCPFHDVEEVWAFDAVSEYGLPSEEELVPYYQQVYDAGQGRFAEQVYTAGYYKTMISGAIEAFGWEMLLESASDRSKFERVLDSFYRATLHHVRAWAKTTAPVFIQHDDFVWSNGPFIHPDFYRSAIIPRYAELWRELHAAGKKVLFCADADWSMFVDDIAEAGADGFIFEPMLELEGVVRRYGKSHVIVGSKVDCRTMTFGTREEVRRQVDQTLELAMDCPGFMFAVGNHIPSNVPVEMALDYIDYLRGRWERTDGTPFGGCRP